MLYIVTYRNRKSNHATNELVVCNPEELFSICWIFTNLPEIIEYTVSCASGKVEHSAFGWGKMEKWVLKFDWDK